MPDRMRFVRQIGRLLLPRLIWLTHLGVELDRHPARAGPASVRGGVSPRGSRGKSVRRTAHRLFWSHPSSRTAQSPPHRPTLLISASTVRPGPPASRCRTNRPRPAGPDRCSAACPRCSGSGRSGPPLPDPPVLGVGECELLPATLPSPVGTGDALSRGCRRTR